MYRVMLVSDNDALLEELQNLHIWGEPSEFEISAVVNDGKEAYRELCRKNMILYFVKRRLKVLKVQSF